MAQSQGERAPGACPGRQGAHEPLAHEELAVPRDGQHGDETFRLAPYAGAQPVFPIRIQTQQVEAGGDDV